MKNAIKTATVAAVSCLSFSSHAVICMATQAPVSPETMYLANNCQYFSGSKELRLNRSGELYNYNTQGSYNDQMYGQSYIYCPIMSDNANPGVTAAKITVSDVNQHQDVVCQLGSSRYTQKGFSAHWGKLTKSGRYGKQTLVAETDTSDVGQHMENNFITCSLPPQDSKDNKASSLIAYSVEHTSGTD